MRSFEQVFSYHLEKLPLLKRKRLDFSLKVLSFICHSSVNKKKTVNNHLSNNVLVEICVNGQHLNSNLRSTLSFDYLLF